eukprot:scaffold224920_cov33-Attheya_sp.AAC.5
MFTLTKPRSATEMQAQAVQVKKSERGSNRDKQKIKSVATRGMEPAFVMMTYSPIEDGNKFSGVNASFELQKIATEGTDTTAPVVFGADKFDLLEKYENITHDKCKECRIQQFTNT